MSKYSSVDFWLQMGEKQRAEELQQDIADAGRLAAHSAKLSADAARDSNQIAAEANRIAVEALQTAQKAVEQAENQSWAAFGSFAMAALALLVALLTS